LKKIYLAGSGGMLGQAFHEVFGSDYQLRCTDKDVNEPWLELLDFRDLDGYRKDVESFRPDYLFHLGAHTDLEYCEQHVEDTYLTNTTSVENAVWIANRLDIPLLYISTAGIVDGSKDSFDDWDLPNPLGHYARSKYAGEIYVTQNARRHLVCRAGWMMGGGPRKDKKFVQKIMKQLKSGKTELNVVRDKLGTPTYTMDFAANVRALVEAEYWGLYNMVCEGVTSRLEVAHELVDAVGMKDRVRINEVDSDFFAAEFFAPRPDSERLLNRKLTLRNMNHMRDWRVALRDYVGSAYSHYL
jgi:dTDP-4-dehydrorhamnose reductase